MKEHPALVAIENEDFVSGIHPFELFCVYHLGLKEDGTTAFLNVHQVAHELKSDTDTIMAALERYGLDSNTLVHTGFDLASAQADIQVSPPGVDLFMLAEMHFESLCESTEKRDWQKELDDDKAQNDALFAEPQK